MVQNRMPNETIDTMPVEEVSFPNPLLVSQSISSPANSVEESVEDLIIGIYKFNFIGIK